MFIYKSKLLSLASVCLVAATMTLASCNQVPSGPGSGGNGDGGNDTTGTTEPQLQTKVYNFDDGTAQGWTLDDPSAEITQAKSFSGSYTLGIDRGEEDPAQDLTAHISPVELDGGVEIDTLTFKYIETKPSNGGGGGGVRLLDNAGDLVVGAASASPWYNYVDKNGPEGIGESPVDNWDTWVQVEIVFDWKAGMADITFTDLEADSQPEAKVTVELASTNGVSRIDIAHYGTYTPGFTKNKEGAGNNIMHFWVDDLGFSYTE